MSLFVLLLLALLLAFAYFPSREAKGHVLPLLQMEMIFLCFPYFFPYLSLLLRATPSVLIHLLPPAAAPRRRTKS